MAYQDLGRYKFVSMDTRGKVGSIYYENGRMRLVHGEGPEVSLHEYGEYSAYFIVPNNFEYIVDSFFDTIEGKSINIACKELSKNGDIFLLSDVTEQQISKIIVNWKNEKGSIVGNKQLRSNINTFRMTYSLYEIYFTYTYGDYIVTGDHLSRGFPMIHPIGDVDNIPYSTDIYSIITGECSIRLKNENLYKYWYNKDDSDRYFRLKGIKPFSRPFEIHNPYIDESFTLNFAF